MKAKRLLILISLSLIVGALLMFAGCSTPDNDDGDGECTVHVDLDGDGVCDTDGCGAEVEPSPAPAGDFFNENGELMLYRAGVPTFKIIKGSDLSDAAAELDDLVKALNKLSASEITVTDYNSEPQAVEILVGSVNTRGAEYKINKYDLGDKGFIVKQIGTKIVVLGGGTPGLLSAVSYLKEDVFGIRKTNENFTDFAMAVAKNKESIQSDYQLSGVYVDGTPISEYSVLYEEGNRTAKSLAEDLQDNLYLKAGIRVEIYRTDKYDGKGKTFTIRSLENDGEGGGFYVYVNADKNMVMECEYAGKYEQLATEYFEQTVFVKSGKVSFGADYNHAPDHRNVYYADYGAIGNGEVNDFEAIRAAHADANANLLKVHADPDATYYIGKKTGEASIVVRTSTYFHGCKFIFDDYGLTRDDVEYVTPIFKIESSVSSQNKSFTAANAPFTSISEGATKIDYKPGFTAMVILYNDNVRHYIRSGVLQDTGSAQQEFIIVDKDGNISKDTPLQWTYDVITRMEIINLEDNSIEIVGADDGSQATFTTYVNACNDYAREAYLQRNIKITRSNVTFKNVKHVVEGEDTAECCMPYEGFTNIERVDNVRFEGLTLQRYEKFSNLNTGIDIARSYEIRITMSNNVVYYNCDQSNFFHDGLRVENNGMMGTNYCKNITLEKCKFNTFDAHKGVYNATIKDSELVYISIIGEGKLTVEKVVFHSLRKDRQDSALAIWIRDDYGSTFEGDFYIKDVTIKYDDWTDGTRKLQRRVNLIDAVWSEHNYGYQTYLPENIYIDNVNIVKVEPYFDSDGVRQEKVISTNKDTLHLFPEALSISTADLSRDPTNPYIGTKNLYITNCDHIDIGTPTSPQFDDLKIYIDNVLQPQ